MHSTWRRSCLALAACVALASSPAAAEPCGPVAVQMEGTIFAASGQLLPQFSGLIPFTAVYSFDPAVPDENPDPDAGVYAYCDFTFDVGGYVGSAGPGHIRIWSTGVETYRVTSDPVTPPDQLDGESVNGWVPIEIELDLQWNPYLPVQPFDDDSLPASPPPLPDPEDVAAFVLGFAPPGETAPVADVWGTVTSIGLYQAPQPVPALAPWPRAVVVLGLIGPIGVRHWLRRRSA